MAQQSETGTCPKSSGPGLDSRPDAVSPESFQARGAEHKGWSSRERGCLGSPPAMLSEDVLCVALARRLPPLCLPPQEARSAHSTESPCYRLYQPEGLEINPQESSVIFKSYGPQIPFDTTEHTRSGAQHLRHPVPGMRPLLKHLFQGVWCSSCPGRKCSRMTVSSSHGIFPVVSDEV